MHPTKTTSTRHVPPKKNIPIKSIADHGEFMLGSLSHLLNARASGYQELPEFPEVAPDPSVRNVEVGCLVCEISGNSLYCLLMRLNNM